MQESLSVESVTSVNFFNNKEHYLDNIVYSVQCTVYSVKCTVCIWQYTVLTSVQYRYVGCLQLIKM